MIACCLTGRAVAAPEEGVAFIQALCRELEIPSLKDFGMSADDADEIVAKAARASSMKANPVVLSDEELKEVYLHSL